MVLQGHDRLPDFIIAGAMKSGTTSLHQVLASDKRIFIPSREIFFFDMDDLSLHPDFWFREGNGWLTQTYSPRDPRTLAWYSAFFAAAGDSRWIGEDSTSYLASARAPERIASLLPKANILLLLLRDPAARAALPAPAKRVRLSAPRSLVVSLTGSEALGTRYERPVGDTRAACPPRNLSTLPAEDVASQPCRCERR